MQHNVDEFSITDVRHVLQEGWRIIRHRRWFFVFPFCAVSTLALICSLWVPRNYVATTVIKREHDAVFTSMMGATWTQPYSEIRTRMPADLRNEETITAVLDELGLPAGLEHFPGGELTPASKAARSAAAADVIQGLTVQPLESSNTRDVVAISLKLPNAERLTDVLAALRDRYIKQARERTVRVLRDAEQFFRSEAERCSGELALLQKSMTDFQARYPSIDPDHPDATKTEQAALVVERLAVERKLDELTARRSRLADKMTRAAQPPDGASLNAVGGLEFQPNPKYTEISQEISRLIREIADKKTLRGMTDNHPIIQQLRTTLAMRQAELADTPREIPADAKTPAGTLLTPGLSLLERLQQDLADVEAETTLQKSRLTAVADQIAELERSRALAGEHRQDYLKLKQRADSLTAELNSWQQNIDPLRHIFTAEDRNRTIHFATVKDVEPVLRPSSPKAVLVIGICLGIGAAVAVLVILLTEFADRSYRSVKHLKSSLGIPVIESINEIVTTATRRRRAMRGLIVLPAAALLGIAVVTGAGALAYLSIENPGEYEALKSTPSRLLQLVGGANRPTVGLVSE